VTLNSATSTLASFTHNDDFATTHIDAAGLTESHVRGLCWTVDPAFGRAVLRKVTVRLKLDVSAFAHTTLINRVGLQIYRRDNAGPDFAPFLFSTFVPLLPNAVPWQPSESSWNHHESHGARCRVRSGRPQYRARHWRRAERTDGVLLRPVDRSGQRHPILLGP
jgi:hypothetical protein